MTSPSLLLPSADYRPHALLKANEPDGYTIELPISHALAHNEADRFLIALPGEYHSQHDFHVTLHHDQGALDCGRVFLDLFEPDENIPRPEHEEDEEGVGIPPWLL